MARLPFKIPFKSTSCEELEGSALDWAVCLAEGYELVSDYGTPKMKRGIMLMDFRNDRDRGWIRTPNYSKDWALAGKILFREKIGVTPIDEDATEWYASSSKDTSESRIKIRASCPLVAAMRCHVHRQLGPFVDIPQF